MECLQNFRECLLSFPGLWLKHLQPKLHRLSSFSASFSDVIHQFINKGETEGGEGVCGTPATGVTVWVSDAWVGCDCRGPYVFSCMLVIIQVCLKHADFCTWGAAMCRKVTQTSRRDEQPFICRSVRHTRFTGCSRLTWSPGGSLEAVSLKIPIMVEIPSGVLTLNRKRTWPVD